jgi:hypothetical protein
MRTMRCAHPNDASESVNVERDLFDVRRVQLRKLGEVTSEQDQLKLSRVTGVEDWRTTSIVPLLWSAGS